MARGRETRCFVYNFSTYPLIYINMITATILLKITDYIFVFIEIILGLRVFLKLLGASSGAPFVNWVYDTSQPFLFPFQGMFPSAVLTGGFVIEPSTLFAIIAYGLLAYGISELIKFIRFSTKRFYNP